MDKESRDGLHIGRGNILNLQKIEELGNREVDLIAFDQCIDLCPTYTLNLQVHRNLIVLRIKLAIQSGLR